MRTTGIAHLAVLAAALAASSSAAWAQDKPIVTQKESDVVRATVSGRVVLDYVYRARELTAYTDSISNAATSAGAPLTSEGENTFEGYVAVRLDVELSNKVASVFEFGTKRADGLPTAPGGGIQRWGDGEAPNFVLREGRIVFQEFVVPQMAVEIGLSTWSFNVRGKGGSLAFDPRHSQTIRRNIDSLTDLNSSEDGDAHFANAAFTDEMDVVGATLSWGDGPARIELVLLPAVLEAGGLQDDEALYALDFLLNLDSVSPGSRLGVILAASHTPTNTANLAPNDNEHATIFTFGGGATFALFERALEIYAEGYVQRGKAGEVDPALGGGSVQARGFTYQVGFEWHHTAGNPMPIWVGVNHFYISGQRSDTNSTHKTGRFSAYESVSDLMIVEDPNYGLDWDSNLMGIKIYAGATFSAAQKDDLTVNLMFGHLRTPDQVDADVHRHDLGDEIDLKMDWHVNKQFVLKLSVAALFGSELLKTALNTDPVTGTTTPGSNPDAKDHTWLYTLGFDLTF